jgi:hypothetical protein
MVVTARPDGGEGPAVVVPAAAWRPSIWVVEAFPFDRPGEWVLEARLERRGGPALSGRHVIRVVGR